MEQQVDFSEKACKEVLERQGVFTKKGINRTE
jgi:hypothetical protein